MRLTSGSGEAGVAKTAAVRPNDFGAPRRPPTPATLPPRDGARRPASRRTALAALPGLAVPDDPRPPADRDVIVQLGAARDPDLRHDDAVPADDDVVADLDEVVDLGAEIGRAHV